LFCHLTRRGARVGGALVVAQTGGGPYNRVWRAARNDRQERGLRVDYRTLGSTGLEVSRLGFGCIKFKGCSQACLRCGYCQPCPNGIDIPAIFRAAGMAENYPDSLKPMGLELYAAQARTADDCDECGQCVECCPAGIRVPERLRETAALFAG
jgi:hypothetical protein